jgi:molybdopterin/thiamine biosynthesis adenylyltransferase/nitroreductase
VRPNEDSVGHQILDAQTRDDARELDRLRADGATEFIDTWPAQVAALRRLRPDPGPELRGECPRWVYYPWRRAVVKVLGPQSFRRLRLDRNRNLITTDEQNQLAGLRIGIVGLSSGHVIAHTIAAQGLCGTLRLTDFDELELSNLNRVPASVFDVGINKATVAARRIAELDPYLTVETVPTGLTVGGASAFLTGLDVVIEECDSLDVKALVREMARARRLPVLMATSDRGLVDVERFDLEPQRPIFHGLLGDLDTSTLAGLSSAQKVPHVLRLVEAGGLTARAAASIVEVGHTLATWPQLAGDVTVGAAAMAEAVRRIGLGEPLSSGRVHLNVGAVLDRLAEPEPPTPTEEHVDDEPAAPSDALASIVWAAHRAPSGGNVQPWHLRTTPDAVTVCLAPEFTSAIDVGFRGSAVAVGAAVFNARAAAAASGYAAEVTYDEPADDCPMTAHVQLSAGADPALARFYPALLRRQTNRRHGAPSALTATTREALTRAARQQGARLHILTERHEITTAAEIFAAADRIRYLTPRLHADMAAELRWPGDDATDTGIDVRSLELGPGGLLALDILKRPEVMKTLSEWDGGYALGAETHANVMASTALALVTVDGRRLADYARGGSAVEAVWITAEELDLAVQPISPIFLYAQHPDELHGLSAEHAQTLAELSKRFRALTGAAQESPVLSLRLAVAPPPSVKSRRRRLTIDVRDG